MDISTTLFEKEDGDETNHFSTSAYVKRLLYENETQTGGLALMAGIGPTPGYLQSGEVTRDFKNYWAYLPWTIPLFDNTLSWDIMPGATYNEEYGAEKDSAWGFLYSSRLAIYMVIPQSAIVVEVFGTEGDAYSEPQYKAGVRWESQYVIVALTYGAALLHGFGFASGLSTVGMPQAEIPLTLLMFNVGVELGQIAFVVLMLLIYRSLKVVAFRWPRWVEFVPGYTIGSLGAYWTIQRTVMMF